MEEVKETDFDYTEWNESSFSDPTELMRKFRELRVVGRKIAGFRIIGIDFIGRTTSRHAEIDEPFVIIFEDGDELDVDYSCEVVKVGLNALPEGMTSYQGDSVWYDANVKSSNCLGETIESIHIETADYACDWSGEIIECDSQALFIRSFSFCLSSGVELEFYPFFDFGEVRVVDSKVRDGLCMRMTGSEAERYCHPT